MTTPGAVAMADVLVVLAHIVALWGPGLVIATCARLRPWTAAATAPLLTYGLVTILAPVLATVGIDWGILPLVAATALVGAAVFGLRLVLQARTSRSGADAPGSTKDANPPGARHRDLAIAGGVLGGAVLGMVTLWRGFGGLQAINNEADVQYHANAIRAILDLGNANPSVAGAIVDPGATTGFYPTTYHALAALVTDATGASIPATMNAHSLLWGLIAGLGLAALLRSFGLRALTCAGAALALPMFSAFPTDLMWWSHLLPFGTGVALIPACLLLLSETVRDHAWPRVPVLAVGAVGLLGLHPSATLAAVIYVLAFLVQRWISDRSRVAGDLRLLAAAGVACAVIAPNALLAAAGVGGNALDSGIQWPARRDVLSAIRDLVLLKHEAAAPMYWLLVLVIAGALTVLRLRRMWWWLGCSAVFAVLFVMATASDHRLTELLTLPWWNDAFRFAALVVFGQAMLAGLGLTTLADLGAALLRRLSGGRVGRLVAAAMVVLIGLTGFGLVSNGYYSGYNSDRMSFRFVESPTLTRNEQDAMDVLADLVEPGDRVMNDPGDGSPWMWSLADVRPIFPHIIFPGVQLSMSVEAQTLFNSFQCLDADPEVRELIEDYNISYAYVGEGFVRADFTRPYGLRDLGAADSLDLVYRQGDIAIYRVDLSESPAPSTAVPGCGRYSRDEA